MIHYKLVVKVQTLSNLQIFSLDRAHNKHLLSYFHNLPLHEYAYLSCSQVEFQRTIDQIYAYPTVSYSMFLHGNTLIALLLHRILQIATNKSI